MKEVRLLKPHRHGPTVHPIGKVLSLPDPIADWLLRQNIATDAASDASGDAKKIAAQTPALLRPCCGRK